MKHIPQRTCACCRKKSAKGELVRIVCNNGEFAIDEAQTMDGRGAYFCAGEECLKKLKKSRALDRAFRSRVPDEVYDDLINYSCKIKRETNNAG